MRIFSGHGILQEKIASNPDYKMPLLVLGYKRIICANAIGDNIGRVH
jgi:hypothetical protein